MDVCYFCVQSCDQDVQETNYIEEPIHSDSIRFGARSSPTLCCGHCEKPVCVDCSDKNCYSCDMCNLIYCNDCLWNHPIYNNKFICPPCVQYMTEDND